MLSWNVSIVWTGFYIGYLLLHTSKPLMFTFPALPVGYTFPRAFRPLYIFLHFPSVTCFPALFLRLVPRPFRRLHVFPRFFSDLFSCPFRRLHVFPRFQSVAFCYTNTFILLDVFLYFFKAALIALSFRNMTNCLLFNYLQLPKK